MKLLLFIGRVPAPRMAQTAVRFVNTPAKPSELGSRAGIGAGNPVIPSSWILDNSSPISRAPPLPTFSKTETNFFSNMLGTHEKLFCKHFQCNILQCFQFDPYKQHRLG